MNLKDFSLLKDEGDHYVIGHPKGKSIQVMKSGLSEKAHEEIKKMSKGGEAQNYDDGGDVNSSSVDDTQDSAPPVTTAPDPSIASSLGQDVRNAISDTAHAAGTVFSPVLSVAGDFAKGLLNTPSQDQVSASPSESTPNPIPNSLPETNSQAGALPSSSAQQSEQLTLPNVGQGLDAEAAALKSGAEAESKEGQQNAQAMQDYINQSQAEVAAQKKRYEEFKQKDEKLQKAFFNKIDPNRYWNDKSTGSKIASSIGLILSGLGSGLTHQPNMAYEMLQNAINRDIDSQKNDQSKTMNLWKMNREAYGNDAQASLATQNQLLSAVKAKALMAQSQAQGPLAQARIAPLIQQIDAEKAQNQWRQTMISSQNSQRPGQLSNLDPAQMVPLMVKNPDQQKEVYSEIGRAQNVTKNSEKIMRAFDQAAKDNTAFRTGAGLLRTPGSVMALHQLMLPNFKQVDGTVRQAAMDESFHNITPQPGDTDAKIALKRQALIDWMHSETAAPTAKGNFIDLSKFRSTYGGNTAPSKFEEGATAINARGQRIIFQNGKWNALNG